MANLQDLLTQNTSDISTLTGLVGQVVTALANGGGAVTQAQLDQLAAANAAVEKANSDLTAALVAPQAAPGLIAAAQRPSSFGR